MKPLILSIGIGGLLVTAQSSTADLVGIVVEQITVTNSGHDIPAGLLTIRISAQFSDEGDQLLGVTGSPAFPLSWSVSSGTWWNSTLGGDGPPSFDVEETVPEVGYDSYMTIGLSNTTGLDALIIAPGTDQADLHGSTVWNGGAGGSTNVAWLVPPTDPSGTPMAQSVAGNSASNRVLLAQMTVDVEDAEQLLIEGTMGLLFQSDGTYRVEGVGFTYIPTPGALALFALAGAATRRRRGP